MDKEWEYIILVFVGAAAAVLVLPKLLPKLMEQVFAHLLSWHLVVPASEAVVRVPSSEVGLDLARLLVIAALLVLVVGAVRHQKRDRRDQR